MKWRDVTGVEVLVVREIKGGKVREIKGGDVIEM